MMFHHFISLQNSKNTKNIHKGYLLNLLMTIRSKFFLSKNFCLKLIQTYLKWDPVNEFQPDQRCEQFRQTESYVSLLVCVSVFLLPAFKLPLHYVCITKVFHHVFKQTATVLTYPI